MPDVFNQIERANLRILDYQTILVPANSVYTYNGNFSTVSVLSVNVAGVEQAAGTIVASLQDQSEANIFGGMYFETQNQLTYIERAQFRNTTGTPTTVVVIFGSGKTEDRRLQLASTITLATNTTILVSTGATITTNQMTATTVGAVLVAADATRRALTIFNASSSTSIFVGPVGVTATTGLQVNPSSALTIQSTGALSVITAASTAVVSWLAEAI